MKWMLNPAGKKIKTASSVWFQLKNYGIFGDHVPFPLDSTKCIFSLSNSSWNSTQRSFLIDFVSIWNIDFLEIVWIWNDLTYWFWLEFQILLQKDCGYLNGIACYIYNNMTADMTQHLDNPFISSYAAHFKKSKSLIHNLFIWQQS